MAKKKAGKKETKSEFLRKVLTKNPNLDHRQVNRKWAGAGHAGEISSPLYYKVRHDLGIVTEWVWVKKEAAPPGRATAGGAGAAATGEVYEFKITLLDTRPAIWRRIEVSDCTLDKLHEHIQTAMGWTNSHMHQFRINGKEYGDPMLLAETFEERGFGDSTRTMLSDIVPEDGRPFEFEYEYDFGDSWRHEILFGGHHPAEPGQRYPRCVEGARACPPDDVGGVWGYVDFLKAIADPKDEQHQEMKEWIGRKFDPDAFDPARATRRMRAGLPDWRSMR